MVIMSLEARHLKFGYTPGKTVLHDISLACSSGEVIYVLGRNGSGKTTLLSCLAGILRPENGKILVNGENLHQLSHAERARRISLIPQIHTPTFSYSVEEMVMMGRAPHLGWLGSPSRKDRAIVEDVMAQVGIYELRGRPYTEISGGEQQLTLIAMGLAQQCLILLMDEPTAHLDLSNQHRVLEIVQQLSDQGLSFIISSHSPNNALAYADRVLMLTGGWVTASGRPEDTLTSTLLSSVYGVQTEVLYEDQGERKTPIAVITQRPITLLPKSLKDPDSLLSDLFNQSKDSPQLILLTGLSGVGKTTWCSQLVALARERGLTVNGLLSPSVFKEGRKVGINIADLQSGETRQLASLRQGESGKIGTPRWSFDPEVTAWANRALEEAAPSDLLVMDEIGPLELLQGEGITAGLRRLDAGDYKVACVVIRTSLLPNALQRWPDATVVKAALTKTVIAREPEGRTKQSQ
jgi:iron complex transport system ATP-binding protein